VSLYRRVFLQEAQLMLTTGAMRLAISKEVNKHGTILGPLRLFAKHVTGSRRHRRGVVNDAMDTPNTRTSTDLRHCTRYATATKFCTLIKLDSTKNFTGSTPVLVKNFGYTDADARSVFSS